VAGTNGKGSTVATLDALLRGAGLRTGRYTSPHLVDFQERIVVDGTPMPREAITAWLTRWEPEIARLGATFFEATTVMALSWFAEAGVDVAVVEVGLGGRLDATNVVRPVASAVTQIGFDHMEYLGDTLERIATEKAGVFKPGVAAVVGEANPAIRAHLAAIARRVGARPVLVRDEDWRVDAITVSADGTRFTLQASGHTTSLATPLIGEFQAHNTATALAMLRAAGGRWAAVAHEAPGLLAGVHLAGRLHRSGPWLFDVAHNPDGAATVAATLRALDPPRPLVAVVSVLRDKDWRGILREVASVADRIILTQAPTAPAARAWDPAAAAAWAAEAGMPAELERRFDVALERAVAAGRTVLVTGSFHTVGDAMARLQVDPLAR
jgi:dihydrofolate synthase/folylpolyglutamate synthase